MRLEGKRAGKRSGPPGDRGCKRGGDAVYPSDGLVVAATPLLMVERKRWATRALGTRLPTASGWKELAQASALLNYGASLFEMYRRAATFVDKILKGISPAKIPVEQPMHFHCALNLKTAQALGLTIPPHVLLQATEVVQ